MSHIGIGLITIFAIVLVPVYVFVLASFLGKPRIPKVAIVMLGLPAALSVLIIIFIWLFGSFLSLIVP